MNCLNRNIGQTYIRMQIEPSYVTLNTSETFTLGDKTLLWYFLESILAFAYAVFHFFLSSQLDAPARIIVRTGRSRMLDDSMHPFIVSSQGDDTELNINLDAADLQLTEADVNMLVSDDSDGGTLLKTAFMQPIGDHWGLVPSLQPKHLQIHW